MGIELVRGPTAQLKASLPIFKITHSLTLHTLTSVQNSSLNQQRGSRFRTRKYEQTVKYLKSEISFAKVYFREFCQCWLEIVLIAMSKSGNLAPFGTAHSIDTTHEVLTMEQFINNKTVLVLQIIKLHSLLTDDFFHIDLRLRPMKDQGSCK